jgi:hypothetical protein
MESAAVLAFCLLVAVVVNRRLLHADVFEGDALVHQYWMWHWRDPQLFNDPLTAQVRDSARDPLAYQALFWAGTQLVSPIVFGEWVGVALMTASGWLIFRIVRDHSAWRPAGWIAAALFLALVDIHRFSGGFARAFVQPVVLMTLLLALRRRHLPAALVAAGGALLYPPAAVLAVGLLLVAAVGWSGGRPSVDRRAGAFALRAGALALGAELGPQLLFGAAPTVLAAAQARRFPEFGAQGSLHFFVPSLVEYLKQNRSGFDLRASGSILVLAAAALLIARPANLVLVRRPVRAMAIASLGAYAAAQLVLFRLYLPHRYTYPLVAFAAIAVGVGLLPTWTALWRRTAARPLAAALLCGPPAVVALALHAFPLGPQRPLRELTSTTGVAEAALTVAVAAAAAVLLARLPATRRASVAALLSAATLLGLLAVVPDHPARGWRCPQGPAVRYLASLPKDAIIAGDPRDMNCLPGTTRRAVVISTQLAPSYEVGYFHMGRERMFASLRATYSPSLDAVLALRSRYGATDLWVRRDAVHAELGGHGDWSRRAQPYRSFVKRLVRGDREPASLHLPASCRRFASGHDAVYDLACITAKRGATG